MKADILKLLLQVVREGEHPGHVRQPGHGLEVGLEES